MAEPEIVVGVVGREALSSVLTGLHRGGYGHVSRVLDPVRADVAAQLRRAGSGVPLGLGPLSNDHVLVMVSAPARTGAAADLLRRCGAGSVWETERTTPLSPVFVGPVTPRARTRRTLPGPSASTDPVPSAGEATAD